VQRTGLRVFQIHGMRVTITGMKKMAVRTSIGIPEPLYRKVKEQAAAEGCSIHELILLGINIVVTEPKCPQSKRVRFPLIISPGRKVNVTNELIYQQVAFP
jgi:hypothetical protein